MSDRIVSKCFLRLPSGEIDYNHPYDLISTDETIGLYNVFIDDKMGWIDETGKIIIPINYDHPKEPVSWKKFCPNIEVGAENKSTDTTELLKNFACVCYKDNKVEVINGLGEKLVPFECVDARIEEYPFVTVASQNFCGEVMWGVYDCEKNVQIVDCQYPFLNIVGHDFAVFSRFAKEKLYGLMDVRNGKVLISEIFEEVSVSKGSSFVLTNAGKLTYVWGISATRNVFRLPLLVNEINGESEQRGSDLEVLSCHYKRHSYDLGSKTVYFNKISGYICILEFDENNGGVWAAYDNDGREIPVTEKMKETIRGEYFN